MNVISRSFKINEDLCKKLTNEFEKTNLELDYNFFKSGKKDSKWFDGCFGLEVKLNGDTVFLVSNTTANIKLNSLPQESRDIFLKAIDTAGLLDKKGSSLAKPLGIVFLLISGLVTFPYLFKESMSLGYFACASLLLLIAGVALLNKTNFTLEKNISYTSGLTIFCIGALPFAPLSLLLKPFIISIIENKLFEYLERK